MKLKPLDDGHGNLRGYAFHCPGCDHAHVYYTSGPVVWSFDGNMETPTFSPSLLNRCPDHTDPKQRLCHLTLASGMLHFYPDCSHDLAGRVVELPEYPYG